MRLILVCLFLISTATACAGEAREITAVAATAPHLTLTPSETPYVIPALTGVYPPTPTTLTYTVVKDDTLTGIAGKFGVSLDELLAANPGLQPAALQVGTVLVIPSHGITPGETLPTPAPLLVIQTHCWPDGIGGLWCFTLLRNEHQEIIENLSAQFTLLDADGKEIATQTAYALLNIITPGRSFPLVAHFSHVNQTKWFFRVQVLTAIRLLPGDDRYLPVSLDNTLVSLDASGRIAQVNGRVLVNGKGTAATLWVLATAFDVAGNVVGVRRWESSNPLTAASPVLFAFSVFSVGPEIDHVEFLAEARP